MSLGGLSSLVFAVLFAPFLKWVILDYIAHRPITVKTRVINYLRQAPNLRAQRQNPPRRISAFLIQSSASTLSVLDLISEYSQSIGLTS